MLTLLGLITDSWCLSRSETWKERCEIQEFGQLEGPGIFLLNYFDLLVTQAQSHCLQT